MQSRDEVANALTHELLETSSSTPSFMSGYGSRSNYLQGHAYNNAKRRPKVVRFAYLGLSPGKLAARRQLVEKHEVSFSAGVAGTYWLHVSLRPQLLPVSGSPFLFKVAAGPAHPLLTQIPEENLPLRGILEPKSKASKEDATEKRYRCEMKLVTRDKMGNACTTGDAEVTSGYLGEVDGLASASCTNVGDGTYMLTWWAQKVGDFHVFVKIDGLHVLGSPTSLSFLEHLPPPSPQPKESPSASAKKKKKQIQRSAKNVSKTARPLSAS